MKKEFFELIGKEELTEQDYQEIERISQESRYGDLFLEKNESGMTPIAYAVNRRNVKLEGILFKEMSKQFLGLIEKDEMVDEDYQQMEGLLQEDGDGKLLSTDSGRGMDPLYHACVRKADFKMATILMEYGADPERKNENNSYTPYDFLEKRCGEGVEAIKIYSEDEDKIEKEIWGKYDRKKTPDKNMPGDDGRWNRYGEMIQEKKQEKLKNLVEIKRLMESEYGVTPAVEVNATPLSKNYQPVLAPISEKPVPEKDSKKNTPKEKKLITNNPISQKRLKAITEMFGGVCKDGEELTVNNRVVGKDGNGGSNLLHQACAMGNADIAKELMAAGADINVQNSEGYTSLHLACISGKLKIVENLRDRDADFTVKNNNIQTPLHILASFSEKIGDKQKSERVKIAKLLIEEGVSLTSRDHNKKNAAEYSYLMEFEALTNLIQEAKIKQVENPKYQEVSEERLLEIAKGYYGMFEGAVNIDAVVVDEKNKNGGGTLLQQACAQGDVDIVKELIAGRANLNRCNAEGCNALFYACVNGSFEVIEVLVDAGVDVMMQDDKRRTALHIIAASSVDLDEEKKSERTKAAKLLLENGADPTIRDVLNRSISWLFNENGYPKLAEYVKEEEKRIEAVKVKEINALMNSEDVMSDELRKYAGRKMEGEDLKFFAKSLFYDAAESDFVKENSSFINMNSLFNEMCGNSLIWEESLRKQMPLQKRSVAEFYKRNPDHISCNSNFLERIENISPRELQIEHMRLGYAITKDLVANGIERMALVDLTEDGLVYNTSLTRSCKEGNFYIAQIVLDEILKQELEVTVGVLNVADLIGGSTALHYCAGYNNKESASIMKQVLQIDGVNPDAKDVDGYTPLADAIGKSNTDAVRILMQRGAKLGEAKFPRGEKLKDVASEEVKKAIKEEMEVLVKGSSGPLSSQVTAQVSSQDQNKFIAKPITQKRLAKIARKYDFEFTGSVFDIDEILINRSNEGGTLLGKACFEGDIDIVNELVEAGADVNKVDDGKYAPIHYACTSGKVKIVKKLIDRDAIVNVKDNSLRSPLHILAATSKDLSKDKVSERLQVANLLFESGVNTDDRDKSGFTAGQHASDKYFLELAQVIGEKSSELHLSGLKQLDVFMNANNSRDLLENYSGVELEEKSLQEVQKFLGLKVADVDATKLLFVLCSRSLIYKIDSPEYLSERKKNISDFYKENPKHPSYVEGFSENEETSLQDLQKQEERLMIVLAKDLISSGAVSSDVSVESSFTPLVTACFGGNFSIAQIVLDDLSKKGPEIIEKNVNYKCGKGEITALHHCANYDNDFSASIARQILQKEGAKVDEKDAHGYTALSLTIIGDSPQILEVLLENGAQLSLVSKSIRNNASDEVKEAVKRSLSTKLLAVSANIDGKEGNRSELLEALKNNDCEAAKKVLQKVVNKEEKENLINSPILQNKYSPIQLAVSKGNLELINYLIDEGAEFGAQGKEEKSYQLLGIACFLENPEIVKVLLERLDVNKAKIVNSVESVEGRTILHDVCEEMEMGNGFVKIAELLLKHGANPEVKDSKGKKPEFYIKDADLKNTFIEESKKEIPSTVTEPSNARLAVDKDTSRNGKF